MSIFLILIFIISVYTPVSSYSISKKALLKEKEIVNKSSTNSIDEINKGLELIIDEYSNFIIPDDNLDTSNLINVPQTSGRQATALTDDQQNSENEFIVKGYPGPSISTPTYSPAPAYNDQTITIQSTITDSDGVRWADLYYTIPGTGTFEWVGMTKAWFSDVWSANIGPFPGYAGTCEIFIQAMDNTDIDYVSPHYTFQVLARDTTPPTITFPSSWYSPNPAYDINQITISCTITDTYGVDRANLYYTYPGESSFYSVSMTKALFSDTWSGKIGPFTGTSGTVRIFVQAIDNYENAIVSSERTFYVTKSDSDPPTLSFPSDWYSPQPPTDKDAITIKCTVTDSSGVDYVNLQYSRPGETTLYTISMSKAIFSDVWSANIGPFDGMSGTVRIYIIASDTRGNSITSSLRTFTVVRWDDDAPIVTFPSAWYSPNPATDVDQITITCTITDSPSGVYWADLYYTQPGGSSFSYVHMTKVSGDTWTGKIGPFTDKSGTVRIFVQCCDNEGNAMITSERTFSVSIWDTTAPSVSFPTSWYTPNPAYDKDEITITCYISDSQSGVYWADLYFTQPGGSSFTYVSMNHVSGTTWTAKIGSFDFSQGIIRLFVQCCDYEGNAMITSERTISIQLWDTTPPNIEEPLYVTSGTLYDTTNIRITCGSIEDSQSGIQVVYLYYTNPGETQYNRITMTKNIWGEWIVDIGPFIGMSGTVYDYIEAIDNYGNVRYSSDYHFEVLLYDETPPTNPTDSSSSTHTINIESFLNIIQVEFWGASDDKSGIAGFSVHFSTDPNFVPPASINHIHDIGGNYFTSDPLVPGEYWLLIRTVDNNGNWATDTYKTGPFIISSAIDYGCLNKIEQDLMVSIFTFFEEVTEYTLDLIPVGIYNEFVFTIPIDTLIGARVELKFKIGIEVVSNGDMIFTITTILDQSKNVGSFYGLLYQFSPLVEKLEFLGINCEFGFTLLGDFTIVYNRITRDWRMIDDSSVTIGFYYKVSYDYLRWIIMSVGTAAAMKLYDAANQASDALFGFSLSELVTGYIQITLEFTISHQEALQESRGTFRLAVEVGGLSVQLDGGGDPEIEIALEFSGSISYVANQLGSYFEGNITIRIIIVFKLMDIFQTVPILKWIAKGLELIGLGDFDYSLTITLLDHTFPKLWLERNPQFIDSDEDGISDYDEIEGTYGSTSDPNLIDTDDDGLTDYEEIFIFNTDVRSEDTDGDFITDFAEVYVFMTNPLSIDTDSDWLFDYEEVLSRIYFYDYTEDQWYYFDYEGSDPLNPDTDGDGFSDAWEVLWYWTNPSDYFSIPIDSDGDTLYDTDEIYKYLTNPDLIDTDGDTLSDDDELFLYLTDPTNADTDGDTMRDDYEIYYSLDPFNDDSYDDPDNDGLINRLEAQANTNPQKSDTDNDLIPDNYEVGMGLNPLIDDSDEDPDYDSLTNYEEYIVGTDPFQADTDHDGVFDGLEVNTYDTNPLNPDSDYDNIDDGDEIYIYGTNPTKPDSDYDGLNDFDELFIYYTEPLNPDSDSDGLNDYQEVITYSTNPEEPDSDFDGIDDYDEVMIYGTNPNLPDTDGDGLSDYDELFTFNTNPILPDMDSDGLTDYDEIFTHFTNPQEPDSDFDGLNDYAELYTYLTNPNSADTDSDGINDWDEINTYNTNPNLSDSDSDGLTDYQEIFDYYTNPNLTDSDTDGLSDYDEIITYSTNPNEQDTDGDSLTDYEELFTYSTNPLLSDPDDDGLNDYEEVITYNTDPFDNDSDDDYFTDGYEVANGWDPNDPLDPDSTLDFDSDGLTNLEEGEQGTDPYDPDTDGDGLLDGDEVHTDGTLPINPDSDPDGLTDGEEISIYNTYPSLVDTDGDSLSDYDEVFTYFTDPNLTDSDGDGLSDGDEINIHLTNPNLADSDSDGLSDLEEVTLGLDNYLTNPNDSDSDNDNLTDSEEMILGTNPNSTDSDSDGLNDYEEANIGDDGYITDPLDADTDGDTISDYDEVMVYNTNPTSTDSDGDGLSDYDELFIYFTDPNLIDTDGDTILDSEEVIEGSDGFITDPNSSDTDNDGLTDDEEINNTLTDPTDSDTDNDNLSDYEEINTTHTDPTDPDSDDDDLDDGLESSIGTDPNDADSDDDNIPDGTEYNDIGTDPLLPDSDGDTIPDGEEIILGLDGYITDPLDGDTDSDGLSDPYEINVSNTDPTSSDTDDDGLPDGWEVTYALNPLIDDSTDDLDNDGLTNLDEYEHGTNPNDSDTDSDSLDDLWEVNYGTNPLIDDSDNDYDGDGLTNYQEYQIGTLPLDADTDDDLLNDGYEYNVSHTNPLVADTDSDGMPDGWEVSNGLNPLLNDAYQDLDNDGLTNLEEYQEGTLANDSDTDNDTMPDGWEVDNDLDPLINDAQEDPDLDDLVNVDELKYSTDPQDEDTDDDGYNDGLEVLYGSDPNDSTSIPDIPTLKNKDLIIYIGTMVGLFTIITIIVIVTRSKVKR